MQKSSLLSTAAGVNSVAEADPTAGTISAQEALNVAAPAPEPNEPVGCAVATYADDPFCAEQAQAIRELVGNVRRDIIEIGSRLIKVKAKVGHGNFLAWLDREFGWSDETARKYMRIAEAFGSNSKLLGISIDAEAFYTLAGKNVPEAAREEAIDRARAGERVTRAKAREIVASRSPEDLKSTGQSPAEELAKKPAEKAASRAENKALAREIQNNVPPGEPHTAEELADRFETTADSVRAAFKEAGKGVAQEWRRPDGIFEYELNFVEKPDGSGNSITPVEPGNEVQALREQLETKDAVIINLQSLLAKKDEQIKKLREKLKAAIASPSGKKTTPHGAHAH
jgi:hypothetical protein